MTDELQRQIQEAFSYRGDVTLTLADGSTLVGFLGNREFKPHPSLGVDPFVEVYVPGEGKGPSGVGRRVPISTIASVALSGTDHAAPSGG